jgi:hypothetical protein
VYSLNRDPSAVRYACRADVTQPDDPRSARPSYNRRSHPKQRTVMPRSDLLTQLVQQRRVDTTAVWLFPGALAGRPFNAEQLSRRLNAIGIRVRAARNTAMLGLAGEVPAVVLSHLLGLHVRTMSDWVRIAGTTGAEYAVELSRRAEVLQSPRGRKAPRA